MRSSESFANALLATTRGLLYGLFFFLPMVYVPFTLDPLELNKQTVLLVLTCVACLTWIGSLLFRTRIQLRLHWVLVLPILLTLAFLVSGWNSSATFLSFVGGSMQEYTSVFTVAALSFAFFLSFQLFSGKRTHRFIRFLLLLSSFLVGLFALIGLWAGAEMPNTIGTMNAAGIYLLVMTLLGLVLWVSHQPTDDLMYSGIRGIGEQLLILSLSVVTFAYLLILDYGLLWFLFEAGLVFLFVFVFFRTHDFSSLSRFFLPIILCLGIIPFWFWLPSPLALSVPTEVTISQQASRELAYQTLDRVSWFVGSGPGTYAYDYTQAHDPSINQTEFFKTRFDRASSLMLTLVPTVGMLGVGLFLVFFLVIGLRSMISVLRSADRDEWMQTYVLFVPWLVLLLSACLYVFNITLMALLFLLSGLMASRFPANVLNIDSQKQRLARLMFWMCMSVGALGFFIGIFFVSQRYISEMAFAKAVRADRQEASLAEVVQWLDTAATFNRFDDRIYRTLAQALLLRVQEQLQTVSSSDELTDESKLYIQGLMAAAINAGVRATELSPENVLNWLMRGTVYRELIEVVPNAGSFALSAFQTSTQLDPINPVSWTELGTTYLAVAEHERPLTTAEDAQQAEQATALVDEYMKQAEAAFNHAIQLKANYAPAHYQLSLAFQRQGRLDEAIGKMESVAVYNPKDVGVAFQLGQLYLRRSASGDNERAKNAFEYAIMLTPSYSNARWFLASIYEQEGNISGAIEQIEKVLEYNPEDVFVQTRLERLKAGEISNEAPLPLP